MFAKTLFVCLICLTVGQENSGQYFVKRGPVGPVQPVYLTNKQPVSAVEARAVSAEMSEELEEMSKFAATLLRYFDFNSGGNSWLGNFLQGLVSSREGRSELGQFLQWKGDLLQPLAIIALSVLSLYTLAQILLVLAPPAGSQLGRTFSSLSSTLATAIQALYDQLLLIKDSKLNAIESITDFFFPGDDGEDSVEASRRRRAVDDLSNVVFSAIRKSRKYQNNYPSFSN